MEKNKNQNPYYIRVIRSATGPVENVLENQIPSAFFHRTRFSSKRVKKAKKSWCVDSSYYLG